MVEITVEEQNKEKVGKKGGNLRDLWDNNRSANIQIIGDLEEEKQQESEKTFKEIIVKKTFLTWERKKPPKSREFHTG